jgi:hypothetical protein
MADQSELPRPTELVYVPGPSWTPIFAAAGLMALGASTFKGWIYAVVGAALLLFALRSWIATTRDGVGRLPRRQPATTAVIPAEPLRK